MSEYKQYMNKTKGLPISKIDKAGAGDFVISEFKKGTPVYKIPELLNAKFNVNISHVSIKKWLDKQKLNMQKEVAQDMQTYNKFKSMILQYDKEIKSIYDEVQEMKQYAKDQKDLKSYDRMVGRLYQGIELLAKLMGDMKPDNAIDINLIINEINKETFQEHKGNRQVLFNKKIIDVDAEIEEEMQKSIKEING